MKRRDFGITGTAGVAAALTGCSEREEKIAEKPPKIEISPKPYGIQYYEKACEIWDRISTTELPHIVRAADQAASSLKNGKKLYCQIVGGHMHLAEFRPDRPGNPDYLHNWSRHVNVEEFDKIGNGDFIFFDFPRDFIKKAHDG